MCKPGYHFKLCTCAAEDIDEENFWRLLRIDTSPQTFERYHWMFFALQNLMSKILQII